MRLPAVFVPRRKSPLEITLWLLLASITILLSGCGGPLRAYYYEDDQRYRYYETKSDDVLLVSPTGQVGNVSFLVRSKGSPSISEDGQLFWNQMGQSEPFPLLMVGTTTWNADAADWNMAGYEIAPETGRCRPFALLVLPESYSDHPADNWFKKRSCLNLVWDVPVSILADVFFAVGFLVMLTPIGLGGH